MNSVSGNPKVDVNLQQVKASVEIDNNCKDTSELVLFVIKELFLKNLVSDDSIKNIEEDVKKYFDALLHQAILVSPKNVSGISQTKIDQEKVKARALKSLTQFLKDYLEEYKKIKDIPNLNINKELPKALLAKNSSTSELNDQKIKAVSDEIGKFLTNSGVDAEIVKMVEAHLPKIVPIVLKNLSETPSIPTIIQTIIQQPQITKDLSQQLNINDSTKAVEVKKENLPSQEMLKEIQNIAAQLAQLSEAGDMSLGTVKETILSQMLISISQPQCLDPQKMVKIGKLIKDIIWKEESATNTGNIQATTLTREELIQSSEKLNEVISQANGVNKGIFESFKEALSSGYSTKIVEHLLRVFLNPELMQIFITHYLFPTVVQPTLADLNKNSIPPTNAAQPNVPVDNRTSDVQKKAYEEEFSKEGCKLITNIVKEYLFDYILKESNPLNDEIKSITLETVDKIISKRLKENGAKFPGEPHQLLVLKLLSTVPSFLSDYSLALQNLEKSDSKLHPYSNRKENAILSEINKIRMQRGLPPIAWDEDKQQEKLAALFRMITARSDNKNEDLQQVQNETMLKIVPLLFHRWLSIICEPKNIQILMKEFLKAPNEKQSSDAARTAYAPKLPEYSAEVKKEWFKVIQETGFALFKLLKLDTQSQTINSKAVNKLINELKVINMIPELAFPSPEFFGNFEGYLKRLRSLNKLLVTEKTEGSVAPRVQWTLEPEAERLLKVDLQNIIKDKLQQSISLKDLFKENNINLPLGQTNFADKIASVADLVMKNVSEELYNKQFLNGPLGTLLELLSYNKLTKLFLFEYLINDCADEFIKIMAPGQSLYSDKMLRKMSSDQFLSTFGTSWNFPGKESPKIDSKNLRTVTNSLSAKKLQDSNVSVAVNTLLDWENNKLIDEKMSRELIGNLNDPEKFVPLFKSTLKEFYKKSLISDKEVESLSYLLSKNEGAMVFTYLDCRLLAKETTQWRSERWGVKVNELENALAVYVKTPSISPLYNQLRSLHLKNNFESWLEIMRCRYPQDFQEFSENLKEDLEGKNHSIAIIETVLKYVADIKSLSFSDAVMVKELQEIVNSPNSAEKLPIVFSKLKQVNCWKAVQNKIHATWESPESSQVMKEITEYYGNFSNILASIITPPLSNALQISLLKSLRAPLDALLSRNIDVDKSEYQAQVLVDSKTSNSVKLKLIEQAKKRIVFSGCYCGGEFFDQVLDAIKERLKVEKELKVDFISSEIFLTASNYEKIQKLKEKFPKQFSPVVTPEAVPLENYHNQTLGFSTNHTKALVVDGHVIIGGSGMTNQWSNTDALTSSKDLNFRDMDFLIYDPKGTGLAKQMELELMKIVSFWAHIYDENKVAQFLDPKYLPTLDTYASKEPYSKDLNVKDLKVKSYSTGPMEEDNLFYNQLIDNVKKAKSEIMISHMYFFPSEKMLKALIKASRRGVKITITTNKNDSNSPNMHKLYVEGSRTKLAELVKKGKAENIMIYEYIPDQTTLHKKVFVFDANTVAVGSANIGHKSLEGMIDNELNLIVESPSFASETKKILDVDNNNSKEIKNSLATEVTSETNMAKIQNEFLNNFFL